MTDVSQAYFDAEAFYAALDSQRKSKGITWKKLADEAKVSASTLTRMAQEKRPDVDSMAKLASWSGLNVDDFVVRTKKAPVHVDPLTSITTYLGADPNLTEENAAALEAVIKAAYGILRGK